MKLIGWVLSAITWLVAIIVVVAIVTAIAGLIIGGSFAGLAILITGFKFLMSAIAL